MMRSFHARLLTGIGLLLCLAASGWAATPFGDKAVTVAPAVDTKADDSSPGMAQVFPEGYETAIAFNKGRSCGRHYKPVAPWTGRLVLPAPDQREPDGSVFIRVTSSPESGLIGKTLRLSLRAADETDAWFDQVRPDVEMNPKAKAAALKKGDRIPVALDGWKRVSPLESLAAARPGEMDVILDDPDLEGDRLVVTQVPVQTTGSRKTLVRFVGPATGGFRKVVHYNEQSGRFDGDEEFVSIPREHYRKAGDAIPMTCTTGIEASAANEEGWYLYGSFSGSLFRVEALEPRAALRLEPVETITGRDEVRTFINERQFAGLTPDLARRTLWFPTAGNSDPGYLWPVGSRGLLVHVFGWRSSPAEAKNSGVILGLVTGHFAFGEARVVKCPFTGEPRWDITYYQVYVHNPNGIVSCAQTWAAYMGNLRRGWMFTVPVGDTIVRLPGGGMVEAGGETIDWFKVMRREFNLMMAIYRTGAGKGTTAVRTDVSCVQDSHAALYGSFRYFQDLLEKADPAGRDENSELKRITRLVDALERNITFFGISSGKWREFFKKPLAERYANPFTIILDSVLSAGTIFPRSGNDRMLLLLANMELPMWNILISQVGGRIKDLRPLPPSSPRHR